MNNKLSIQAWIVWSIGTLFILYELFITNGFYGVSQVFIQQELPISNSALGTLGFASGLTYSLCQIPAGLIASRAPTKLILSFATIVVALGMLIYQHANSFDTLMLSRMTISVGSSLAFVTTAVIISRWFDGKQFPLVFGLTQCIGNISVVLANMFLPEIINLLKGWRNTSLDLALLGIVILGLVVLLVKTAPAKLQSPLKIPNVSITTSLITVLSSKQVWIASAYTGFLLGSLFNFGSSWQINFQHSFVGNSIAESALINSIMFLGVAIGNPSFGVISVKLKSRKIPLVCGTIGAVALIGLLLFLPQLPHFYAMLLYFLFGFSCSSAMLAYTIVMESLPPDAQGVGIGLCNTITYLVGAILSLIIGSVMHVETSFVSNALFADKVALSLFFFAILQAATISLFIQETYKKD